MDLTKIMSHTMRMCEEYAAKSATVPLTEYEALAYEQACKLVENFCKVQALQFEQMSLNSERELYQERCTHEKWLRNQEKDDEDDSAESEASAA